MLQAYMVLNDGETYTNIEGCRIMVADDEDYEGDDLDAAIKAGQLYTATIFQ